MSFLSDLTSRPLTLPDDRGLKPLGLYLGNGSHGLEVAVTSCHGTPALAVLRAVWKARLGSRVSPLLLVAIDGGKASICGPSGDHPAAFGGLDVSKVEKLCRAALAEPDRHAALRFLSTCIPEVEAPVPGLRNEGLFATHELQFGVPRSPWWVNAKDQSRGIVSARGQDLLKRLGFTLEPHPGPITVLRAAATRTAVAVFLDRNESPDLPNSRFSDLSPVSYALAKADSENLDYVVVSSGPTLRLYPTKTGIGTGRRGRTETFAEVHLELLTDDQLGYLWALFSAEALRPGGLIEEIIEKSRRFAVELGSRLRERIYIDVVPDLAKAILDARDLKKPSAEELAETYQMALVYLFRLLFIAYAEDKELLPYRSSALYRDRSLKHSAQEMVQLRISNAIFSEDSTHWEEIDHLFRAVDKGRAEWGVPAYNGGLFSRDSARSPVGAKLAAIKLSDKVFCPVLTNLLVDATPEGWGPVDFRSLGVREFGTIYEGLLESELSIAATDLAVDSLAKASRYAPAGPKDEVIVEKGRAYLYNTSGARKSTGSFFTKHFAVEHLLDYALEAALKDHLSRLDSLGEDKAASAFFDFRVADIAMGSGHFLVAAVDRIERSLSGYLARRLLKGVQQELARLRKSATDALGPVGDQIEIEDTQLLRRQIARRCIYGVDINPISVELARLGLWIHTFVPGLPLSFLDHNLVLGNSLIGIATIDEANDWLAEICGPLFTLSAQDLVGSAASSLERLGRLSDASAAEIEEARKALEEAVEQSAPARALFDLLTAARIDNDCGKAVHENTSHWLKKLSNLVGSGYHKGALEVLKGIPAFHFPIAFPEVFLRNTPGFDVMVGNPPWEEATVEEDRFWTRHQPGFHSYTQKEQELEKKHLRKARPDLVEVYEDEVSQAELLRRVLTSGQYPGMGTGDPDVYKAFAWRFWNLVQSSSGRIGVVLPRSAFAAKGSKEFREMVFCRGRAEDLTQLLNNRGWVFEDVHPQYTIILCSLLKAPPRADETLPLRGPFRDETLFYAGVQQPPIRFQVSDVISWTDTMALPLLPSEESGEVFAQLRRAPRLDLNQPGQWRARPTTELHATNDKPLMKLTDLQPEGFWPVFKGESFDIWEPDSGTYYAWGKPDKLLAALQAKRINASKLARSPFSEFAKQWIKDTETLPCLECRIAFRDITRATDTRTVRAALLPPDVFATNKAPYFLWPRGDEKDQAFLLSVLCSLPLDWYARRFVEIGLNYHILNPFPIPRPKRDGILWQRAVALAGRLASPDKRFKKWATAVGVEFGKLYADEKRDMVHELDAVVSHLYGLSERQLRAIFETFHEGWDYAERLELTLQHYHSWKKQQ